MPPPRVQPTGVVARITSSARDSRPAVSARAGLLEAVLKPITTAGQVREGAKTDCLPWPSPPFVARAAARANRARARSPLSPQTKKRAATTPPHQQQIKDLKQGIAAFYDESSALWEDVWGSEHMHHGYYPPRREGGGTERA